MIGLTDRAEEQASSVNDRFLPGICSVSRRL